MIHLNKKQIEDTSGNKIKTVSIRIPWEDFERIKEDMKKLNIKTYSEYMRMVLGLKRK